MSSPFHKMKKCRNRFPIEKSEFFSLQCAQQVVIGSEGEEEGGDDGAMVGEAGVKDFGGEKFEPRRGIA